MVDERFGIVCEIEPATRVPILCVFDIRSAC